jgi:hypothetical protein
MWERPRWVRQLVGALVTGLGLALMAFVVLNLAQDGSLWILGRHTEAQIVGMWVEQDVDESDDTPACRWFVRYRFTTPGGRAVTGVSRVSARELASLGHSGPVDIVYAGENAPPGDGGAIEDGGWVHVVYLPLYPAHNRLDESRYVPVLACAYVPLILVGIAGLALGRGLLQTA